MFSGQSFEENIFEMYKDPATGLVNIGQILTVKHTETLTLTQIYLYVCIYSEVVERTGVRRTDPRLGRMMGRQTC